MRPLINGEAYPPYEGGLPVFCELKNKLVPKRLKSKFMV
jgi:6-phosphofructokinase 1